jgi:hypothetical protein
MNSTVKMPPGVNFTKLFARTVFGKKFAVQFHQQISKTKIRSKITKICKSFTERRSPKKVSNLARANVDEIDPLSQFHRHPASFALIFLRKKVLSQTSSIKSCVYNFCTKELLTKCW